ncbi:unnamed protein product [Bursaphelenchus okinawaensis]|uniref:Peptidase A1 domain-containing protein n=1 Tax=Bursaphelenchus okinawaensis TaxID=465554 RepID=A0A811JVX6_9BILA|nr:unnamed protein product [Bursaphelenchus okinawaensis]CAG9084863.1 unnamed protein product [Bursaphelenchus okinawaensis]
MNACGRVVRAQSDTKEAGFLVQNQNLDFKNEPYFISTDNYLLATINIGTPAQDFQLKIDINSNEFWVVNTECKSLQCNGLKGYMYPYREKVHYNQSDSSTAEAKNEKFGLGFGQGFVKGEQLTDTVKIGEWTVTEKLNFISTSEIQLFFGYQPADGILGLGFEKQSLSEYKTWRNPIDDILLSHGLEYYSLQLNQTDEKEIQGELQFGSRDHDICEHTEQYAPSIDANSWRLALNRVEIGDILVEYNGKIALDPSSVWIQAPSKIVNAVYNVIKPIHMSYYGYVVMCNDIKNKPSIHIKGSVDLEISSHNYILDLGYGGGYCAVTLIANDDGGFGGADMIIGEPLLRQYCQSFHVFEKKIGFSKNWKLNQN